MTLNVQSFSGREAAPFIQALAQLRIEVFREYPYLYDGSLEYEAKYLNTFMQSQKSILVVAFDQGKVVGVSTGTPLKEQVLAIQQPWLEHGVNIDFIFYFSESVLLKPYRNQGIGLRFFEEREVWARQQKFSIATFCGVVRSIQHPKRPIGYLPLDQFWMNRGFQKKNGYTCQLSWKEIEGTAEQEHQLQFWEKILQSEAN